MTKFYNYILKNTFNIKKYVGYSNNPEKRWQQEKNAAFNPNSDEYNQPLYRAIRRDGWDNFEKEIVAEWNTEEEAKEHEKFLIALFQTNRKKYGDDYGYNLTDGGDGATGFRFTDDQKQFLSNKKKGKYIGKENPFYGKEHTEQSKQIMSNKGIERYNSNKEKYDALNIQQCKFTTEQCIEIQLKYLNGWSMEKLVIEYNSNLHAMSKIMNGEYVAIKGKSIITPEQFQQIKQEKLKQGGQNQKKFTIEQEQQIINEYLSDIKITQAELCVKYKCTDPTLRKVLRKHNIKLRRRPKFKI